MAKYCPKCGYENDDNAETCISCLAPLPNTPGGPGRNAEQNHKYLEGLIYLRYYTIIGFISLVAGIALDFVFLRTFSYAYLIGPVGAAFSGVSLNASSSNFHAYATVTLIISAVLTVIGFVMLYRGFSVLKTLNLKFSLGKTGTVLEIVGMVLVVIGFVSLLSLLLPYISSLGSSSPLNIPTSQAIAIVGLAFLVIIAVIVLLVGIIMVLIALFRVGDHFNSAVVEVGAILTLFLGIVGTILLFVGFTSIINDLRSKEQTLPTGN